MCAKGLLGLLVAAAVLATSCGGSSEQPVAVSTSPAHKDFISGEECAPERVSGLPEDVGCITEAVYGSNETGSEQALLVYARLDRDSFPRRWRYRLKTPDGEVGARLHAGTEHSYPQAIGGADVDGDGHPEWFIHVLSLASHGTNWERLHVFVVRGGRLQAVTFDGQPLGLNVGGPSRLGEGIECSEGRLVVLRAEARDPRNTRWDVSRRFFTIVGADARLVERSEGILRIDDYNDPDLDPYYRLDCGELTYPA